MLPGNVRSLEDHAVGVVVGRRGRAMQPRCGPELVGQPGLFGYSQAVHVGADRRASANVNGRARALKAFGCPNLGRSSADECVPARFPNNASRPTIPAVLTVPTNRYGVTLIHGTARTAQLHRSSLSKFVMSPADKPGTGKSLTVRGLFNR